MNVFFVFYNFYLPVWGAMAVARFPANKHGVNFLLEINCFDIITLTFSCLRLLIIVSLAKLYLIFARIKFIVTTNSSGFFVSLCQKWANYTRIFKCPFFFSKVIWRKNFPVPLSLNNYYLYRPFYGLNRQLIKSLTYWPGIEFLVETKQNYICNSVVSLIQRTGDWKWD